MYEQMKPYKAAAKKSMAVGMAWLIGGLSVSVGSYLSAVNNGGGAYFITWGAIIFGGIQALRGLYYYTKINEALKEAESKFWETIK